MKVSPLGLPVPDPSSWDQHVPSLEEMARAAGVSRGRGDVEHVCFECGGHLAPVLTVELCKVCRGAGVLTDDEMDRIFGAGGVRAVS